SLLCVGGVDDSPGCGGFTTEFTWPTTAGTTYNILIHGFGSATGNFDLTITCPVPAEITTTPDEFTFVVPIEGSDSEILSITNSGEVDALDLNWTLAKSETIPLASATELSDHGVLQQRFVISNQMLRSLSNENCSQEIITGLLQMADNAFNDKAQFTGMLRHAIGLENYEMWGSRIMMYASSWENGAEETEEYILAQKYAQIEEDKNRPEVPSTRLAGSDGFAYSFKDSDEPDGPVFSWTDISATGTEIFSNGVWDYSAFGGGDDAEITIALPFSFELYGNTYTSVKVSSNGYVTFGPDGTDFTNDPIPNVFEPNNFIGAFWDDIDPGVGGTVHYQSDANQFIVQFTNTPRFVDPGTSLTFQLILNSDGSILYQYLSMSGTLNSASIGIENFNGTIGLEVATNNTYVKDNLAILIEPSCKWLSFSPLFGVTSQGNTDDVTVSVDAAGLEIDTYLCNIIIYSNAANENPVVVPVTMYVGTPLERIGALMAKVEDLNDAGILNDGQANALIVKLEAAEKSLEKGNCQAAVNQLNAFINQVTDFIDEGILTAEQGNELIDAASDIIEILTPCDESKSGGLVSETLSNGEEAGFVLKQNSPNPFHEKTSISFSVSETNHTSMIVYNAVGQQVAVLFDKMAEAGQQYSVVFDGSSHPRGMYFYHLKSGDNVNTMKKMMMVK
ncbi:MAG: T9SS type A sorting domain-containing protein, partial [bacterium]